jgi:hypothetical protein
MVFLAHDQNSGPLEARPSLYFMGASTAGWAFEEGSLLGLIEAIYFYQCGLKTPFILS